jgi:NodT family efflux transporter outer membrane factor (OMF) lipoprotein
VQSGLSRGSERFGRREAGRLTALTLCLGLSACVVGPDYETPILTLPAAWSGGGKTSEVKPALAHWWSRFGDRELDALIEEAVAGNLDVASAKAKVREARASYRETTGSSYPSVDASTSATRLDSGQGGPHNSFKAGFDASWELDFFGANARSAEAAGYAVDAAHRDLDATLLTLVGDVAANYVDLRGLQARIALARRTAASQRETLALTRAKFEAGTASAVDVANAAGQAASTEAGIPTLQAGIATDIHRLSVLTGRTPAELDGRLAVVRDIPRPRYAVAAGVPADILINRPDVRRAERLYAEATAGVGKAEAARYPSASLAGTLSLSSSKIGDLAKASSLVWSFGPSLAIPLFNGGRLAAAVDVAGASRDQSFLSYRSAVLGALEDVENATVALAEARKRQKSLTEARDAYADASRLARSLYQSGASSFLDVLDAERSLYSADEALLVNTTAIATDYVTLNKALGGGWDGSIDAGKPVIVDTDTGPHRRRVASAEATP